MSPRDNFEGDIVNSQFKPPLAAPVDHVVVDRAYGPTCPHCATEVPAAARGCRGCGAMKSVRGFGNTPGEQWARLFVWLPTVGGSLAVAAIATKTFYGKFMAGWANFSMDHHEGLFGRYGVLPDAYGHLVHGGWGGGSGIWAWGPGQWFLITVATWLAAYSITKLWKKIFGSSSDPVWKRKV